MHIVMCNLIKRKTSSSLQLYFIARRIDDYYQNLYVANLIFSVHDIVYIRIVRTVNLLIRKVRDPYRP